MIYKYHICDHDMLTWDGCTYGARRIEATYSMLCILVKQAMFHGGMNAARSSEAKKWTVGATNVGSMAVPCVDPLPLIECLEFSW